MGYQNHNSPDFRRLGYVFENRGRIFITTATPFNPTDTNTGWVECAFHKENIPIELPFFDDWSSIAQKVDEAFDRCTGCADIMLRKAARLFKKEAAKSRWPEGAEL
jgi:hypothetical protein